MKAKGVVMAGGLGTRFRPLTYYLQKCMVPVGPQQKPILEYILRLYRHHHIRDITLLVGYKHQQIRNYFGDGSRLGLTLTYVEDRPGWKGSGMALLNAYLEGVLSEEETLLVYYGDILSSLNLRSMLGHHWETGCKATLALTKGLKVNEGVAKVEGGLVKEFREKPTLEFNATIGVLALEGEVLPSLQSMGAGEGSLDLMGDVIQGLVGQGERVGAYVTDAFWYDVGSVERLERLDPEVFTREMGFLQ